MQLRKTLTVIVAGVCMFVIILDGKTAIAGASEAIALCIRSLIPSLFPFFVLSNLLTGGLLGSDVRILRPLGRLFRMPSGTESLLIPAFLGGYPVGAQSIASAWRNGQLADRDARRMIAFCNNPGPSFLFGILAPILSPEKAWILWMIQFFCAWAVSLCIPADNRDTGAIREKPVSLPEAITRAVTVTASVCGWVLLLRILIAFLSKWFLWLLPVPIQTAVIGFLELANGCISLAQISDPEVSFLLAASMLSFGGVCVTLQTLSAAQGLDLRYYFPGKILQCALSFLLACLLSPGYRHLFLFPIPIIAGFSWFLRKQENKCGNPAAVGV